ncbi:MAG: signal peptidase II [Phycisphaerae bacterium]|nr:signal peptidase II [Phycisphaerae bacterium]
MAESPQSKATTRNAEVRPAWSDVGAHLRFWIAAVSLLALDLFSKWWVFSTLKPDEVRTLIPGTLELRRSLNDGAVFGSFSGYTGVFVVASIFALAFVVYLFLASARNQRLLQICLGMILAGACGNLYDRLAVQADVVRVNRGGQLRTVMIGQVLSEPGAERVQVGHWPEGDRLPPRTFDREDVVLSRQGVVRDFLKFVPSFPQWVPRVGGREVWPWVFNVADAALVCGVILLVGTSLFDRRGHQAG